MENREPSARSNLPVHNCSEEVVDKISTASLAMTLFMKISFSTLELLDELLGVQKFPGECNGIDGFVQNSHPTVDPVPMSICFRNFRSPRSRVHLFCALAVVIASKRVRTTKGNAENSETLISDPFSFVKSLPIFLSSQTSYLTEMYHGIMDKWDVMLFVSSNRNMVAREYSSPNETACTCFAHRGVRQCERKISASDFRHAAFPLTSVSENRHPIL